MQSMSILICEFQLIFQQVTDYKSTLKAKLHKTIG